MSPPLLWDTMRASTATLTAHVTCSAIEDAINSEEMLSGISTGNPGHNLGDTFQV